MLLNRWQDLKNDAQGVFGIFTLDGSGNITGSATVVGPIFGETPLQTNFVGTYSVKSYGTGTIQINFDFGVSATIAIVVVDGGAGILLLQTDESDGFGQVASGTARLQ